MEGGDTENGEPLAAIREQNTASSDGDRLPMIFQENPGESMFLLNGAFLANPG